MPFTWRWHLSFDAYNRAMELKCPSCGNTHQSDDYPGAFELQCSCGYSILIPDEQAFTSPIDNDEPDYSAAPMAMSEYDDAHKISIEEEEPPEYDLPIFDESIAPASALHMTPPENLPDEMPYDPFELQDSEIPGQSDQHSPPVKTETRAAIKTAGNKSSANQSPPIAVQAQDVAHKIQLASLGYLLGTRFDLKIKSNLSDQQLAGLLDCADEQLASHPWLKEHYKQTRENLEKQIKRKVLSGVPELIALDMYMYCLENNLSCDIDANIG